MREMKFSGGALFGIVLITIGVISLLSGLNYFDSWYIFSNYWPLVIVLFGVKHMIDYRSSTMFGLILILIGAFLQLDRLNLWYFSDINVKELIIPVIIILIGLNFVFPKKNGTPKVDVKDEPVEATPVSNAGVEESADEAAQEVAEEVLDEPAEEVAEEVIDEAEKVDAAFVDSHDGFPSGEDEM